MAETRPARRASAVSPCVRVGVAVFVVCSWLAPVALAQQPRPFSRPPVPVRPTQTKPTVPPKPREAAQHVIAVVHRLSGWKLRTLLTPGGMQSGFDLDDNFVRTNIVAGFILPDGRSVVARLPRAEAEMLTFSTAFRLPSSLDETAGDSELLLMRPDGAQFNARFIGLDASTGLSLLESDKPLLAPAPEAGVRAAAPVVGQRVRLIAPVRAPSPAPAPLPDKPPAAATTTTNPTVTTAAATAKAARPDSAPVGDEGFIYMNMGEEAGQLREVKRSPSGRAMEFTVEVPRVSPEWAGGVALSETGTLVGIVEESDARETRLLSAEIVRGAARRVRARRSSVPQPWLGARGDAVAFAPLEQLLARGWPREQAQSLLNLGRGVLLTSVAPGTPAAHAGLRPGDVVSRIGQHDVRSIEDMSLMLRELGGNSLADFTVLRAESAPLKLAVRLSESPSPGLATARAELRAAQIDLRAKQFAVNSTLGDVRRFEMALRQLEGERQRLQDDRGNAARIAQLQIELRRAQAQFQLAQQQERKFSAEFELMRARLAEAETRYRAASEAYNGLAVKPLLSFGLEAVRISPAGARSLGARQSGLLVMSVHPGSAAAQGKLQAGDIIESINGQPFNEASANFQLPNDLDAELTLGVLRDGAKLSLNLTRPNPQ